LAPATTTSCKAAIATANNDTASAVGGNITNNNIVFGGGAGDIVEVGAATANVTATDGETASATVTENGGIRDNVTTFGNGKGDGVQVALNVTVTENATGSGSANATATATAGDISHNVITFGNGDGDFVQVGTQVVTSFGTVDATNAVNITETANGTSAQTSSTVTTTDTSSINNDTVTFGNGNQDFAEVNPTNLVFGMQTATNPSNISPGPSDTTEITENDTAGSISNNNITFWNGNGDFVAIGPLVNLNGGISQQVTPPNPGNNISDTSQTILGPSAISNNTIQFGDGASDYVSRTPATSAATILPLAMGAMIT
jgi:hypothetical protein